MEAIQVPVHVHGLISPDFHLPNTLTWHNAISILQRGFKFIAPGASVTVAIAIVVTAKKISARFTAALYVERNIDRLKKLFGELGRDLS